MKTYSQSALLTHWGPFTVEGDGKRLTVVHDHPADPDPSNLGQSLRQAQQCRIERPSVRKSWLDGGPGHRTDLRGQEAFVEVDWQEALDLVAAELARVRDDHGHASVFGGSYGWGSAGRFHSTASQTMRFMRQFGGCTDAWGTYSSSAGERIIPYIFGQAFHEARGKQTSWGQIAEHTELFVSFGGLRLNNTQVTYTGQGPHATRGWMQRCRERGMRFLNVSPLRDDIGAEFEPEWIHPRPGTDVALMAGIIHTLVTRERHNTDFLTRHCTGWDRLESYILGRSDGTAKSASWAAEITGLPATEIVALAEDMASRRTLINVTFAVQRQDHGEQVWWMAVALAAALGQIGLPGGGFTYPFGSAGSSGAGQSPMRVSGLPVPRRPEDCTVISVSRVTELLEAQSGEQFEFNGESHPWPDTRLVYWAGGNVFHHHQDLNRLRRAWQRPETIIVHEPWWTPMAKFADIVLPTTTSLERSDLGAGETMLLAMRPVEAPFGEARDDYGIYCELANRLGFGDAFSESRSADEWVEHLYEQFRAGNNTAPPFEEFQEQGTLLHDMPAMGDSEQVFLADFRADPVAHPLRTPSGRIELFSATIDAYGYDDCPGHPAWLEPYERLGTPAAERHPLHLVSNQPTGRLHSQLDHGEASQATKLNGREVCRLNPADAASRGISDGDVIRLFNDRGTCLAAARLSEDVMVGVAQLPTGAWYDPEPDGTCRHGNPNVLTRDKGTSRLAQGPTAHTCLIEVERFDGEAPRVAAFDPPEIIRRS